MCLRADAIRRSRFHLLPLKSALRIRLVQLFETWSSDVLAGLQHDEDALGNLVNAGVFGDPDKLSASPDVDDDRERLLPPRSAFDAECGLETIDLGV
jgi:hypothetical protein